MDVKAALAEREELQARLADIDTLSDEEADTAIARSNELAGEIGAYNDRVKAAEEARAKISNASPSQIVTPGGTPAARGTQVPTGVMTREKVFERFTSQDDFRALARTKNGTAAISLDADETRALFGVVLGKRDISDLTTVVQPVPTPGILPQLLRPLRVADLFDRQTTDAGALTYVRDTTAHPEGSAAAVSPGAQKPESDYTFEVISTVFSKIAHILPVPMEALEDNKQLEGYLSGQMVYGLNYKVDHALLNGTGVPPEIEGVITAGTPYTAAGGEEIIDSIRKMKTKAEIANVNENELSVVMNPTDWEAVELARADQGGGAGTGAFLSLTSAFAGVGPRIWGMPVVVSNACPQGTAIVGAFRVGGTLWDRMEATVAISDSNQNYFEKNILTMRAELRMTLALYHPNAFQVGTLA